MRSLRHALLAISLALCGAVHASSVETVAPNAEVELGRKVFIDANLSRDGRVSCQTCHDPAHAYADPHPRSIGVNGTVGTRNAPSLLDVASYDAFFWDGRRTSLGDAVLDPFTNPAELGLRSADEAISRLLRESWAPKAFETAYPHEHPAISIAHVRDALVAFIRSLDVAKDSVGSRHKTRQLDPIAQLGRTVFEGIGGCIECHPMKGREARLSDGSYHRSGIGDSNIAAKLPALTTMVVSMQIDSNSIGPRVLHDADWSALGRFVVSKRPLDVMAFRTPSLRNVALTAPYMHDGSIATLAEAIDHEIYYHSIGRPSMPHISADERLAVRIFLETLDDDSASGSPTKP